MSVARFVKEIEAVIQNTKKVVEKEGARES